MGSCEFFPLFRIDVRLVENAAQSSDRDFPLFGNDRGVDDFALVPNEFDMAALLAGFDKARAFEAALNLAVREGLKPPQFRPRSYRPWAGG